MKEKNVKDAKNIKENKKNIYIIVGLFLIGVIFLILILVSQKSTGNVINGRNGDSITNMKEFNDCLADNGVVIYGAYWCSACSQLVELLGGYNAVESVYVECAEEQQKCQQEMIGTGIPEIQINGEMYQKQRTLEGLSQITGCSLPK
jgi:hypothetical protein